MSGSAQGGGGGLIGGTAVDFSTDMNTQISKVISDASAGPTYGSKLQLNESSIGSLTVTDQGTVAGAFQLAQEAMDSSKFALSKAFNLEDFKVNPLAALKPFLWVAGGIAALCLLIFFWPSRRRDK